MTWRKPLWNNGSASFLYSARFGWGACHGGYSCPNRPPIASKYLCAHAVSNLAYPAAFVAIRATSFFGVGNGGILRFLVLIIGGGSIGKHALMQDAGNHNTTTLLAVEHDVFAML